MRLAEIYRVKKLFIGNKTFDNHPVEKSVPTTNLTAFRQAVYSRFNIVIWNLYDLVDLAHAE